MDQVNFLFKRQYGFRKNSNCISYAVDYVNDQLDKCQIVMEVLLDLSKAFDMVAHDKLLSKIDVCGVRSLFRSFFDKSKQYVEIHGHRSNIVLWTRDVPQGSCLGPVFFLIYVNSVCNLEFKARFSFLLMIPCANI